MLCRRHLVLLLGPMLACGSAYAASVVEEFTPATAAEGLLFGLTHPLAGVDHLGAIVAIAMIAVMVGASVRLPLVFVLASFAGLRLHGFGVELPLGDELLTGLSTLGFGLALIFGWSCRPVALTTALVAAGLAHGYAYGEHVDAAAVAAFLTSILGLAMVQVAMVVGVFRAGLGWAARRPWGTAELYRTVGGYAVMAGTIALLVASA
jgi:urease accessory protein